MIQKIDIKDASIAEEIRKNIPTATATDKGFMSPSSVLLLNTMRISTGVTGGGQTKYIGLMRIYSDYYKPSRVLLSYGMYASSARNNIDLVITYGAGVVYKSGNGYGTVGYVKSKDDTHIIIFLKCLPTNSVVGTIVSSFVGNVESTNIEPEGIVYFE